MKIPKSMYNWLSIAGMIVVANAIALMILFFSMSVFIDTGHAYLGLYLYIVLPALLFLGIILVFVGMFIKMRNLRKHKPEDSSRWPVLNLNLKKQRVHLGVASIVTIVFILVSAAGSYQAYHYTESTGFCGTLCHSVMHPEYTTYLNSPHARVKCVDCHVGEGADWYVKSKLSGLYQVYSVLFKKYPKPVPTPIHDLRPARETCENCHWPEKFYAKKLRVQRSFLSDSTNTAWNTSLLMKIGPDFSTMGLQEGIHWHINPDIRIEYKASTTDREVIPWVKYTNLKTGEVQIYKDQESLIETSALDSIHSRTFDCMDCHNRPSHQFNATPVVLNNALLAGLIPKELKHIKKAALRVLKDPFPTSDSARLLIKEGIYAYYQEKYPEIFSSQKALIAKAIAGIQQEYLKNNFPEMKITGTTYLNHIGHLSSDGCFRCHNGRHSTDKGKIISKDCNLCHTIVAQGTVNNTKSVSMIEKLDFEHPIDIGNDWYDYACTECHRNP